MAATVNLIHLCARKAELKVTGQLEFINHPKVRPFINRFRINYADLYQMGADRLYQKQESDQPALVGILRDTYEWLLDKAYIQPVDRLHYLEQYIRDDLMVDSERNALLTDQLSACLSRLSTLKEADLCNSKSMSERIYVTTVHKAKGLEFDNVIIYDAAEGRYPNFANKSKKQDEEDARKFYVALSRAQKRLYVAYGLTQMDRSHKIHSREITPFMEHISKYFS